MVYSPSKKPLLLTIAAIMILITGCAQPPQIPDEQFDVGPVDQNNTEDGGDNSSRITQEITNPVFVFYPSSEDSISYNVQSDRENVPRLSLDWDITIQDVNPQSTYDEPQGPGLYFNLQTLDGSLLQETYNVSEKDGSQWRSEGSLQFGRRTTEQVRARCQEKEEDQIRLEGTAIVNPEEADLPTESTVRVNPIEEADLPSIVNGIGYENYTQEIIVECPTSETELRADFDISPEYPATQPGETTTVTLTANAPDTVQSYNWRISETRLTGKDVSTNLSAGEHDVTLIAAMENGSTQNATKTITVTEEEPPELAADIVRNPDGTTDGEPYAHQTLVYASDTFTGDREETDLDYEWMIDGTTAGSADSITQTFNEPGTKQITLTVQDRYGQNDTHTETHDVQPPANYEEGIPNVDVEGDSVEAGSPATVTLKAQEQMTLKHGQIMMFFDGLEPIEDGLSGAIPQHDGMVFDNIEDNNAQWNIAFASSPENELSVEDGETLLSTTFSTDGLEPGTYEIRMPVEDQSPNTPRGEFTQLSPTNEQNPPRGLPNAAITVK